MRVAMIAAMAAGRVIGRGNQMPWHMPADLKHFKEVTMNKPVLMGRKTFESIGRPLPGRRNIIISRQPLDIEGAEWADSIEQALEKVADAEEVMVIGGGEIYRQCLARASRLYLTLIEFETEGDAWFPDYQQDGEWLVTSEQLHLPDERNPYAYRFLTLDKKNT